MKSINWPTAFRSWILEAPNHSVLKAPRLGRLYYDNHYWSDGDEVLIRCNHKVIRPALVVGHLLCKPLNQWTPRTMDGLPPSLQSLEQLIDYLANTYQQPVDETSEATLVSYQVLPINPDLLEVEDDPHM